MIILGWMRTTHSVGGSQAWIYGRHLSKKMLMHHLSLLGIQFRCLLVLLHLKLCFALFASLCRMDVHLQKQNRFSWSVRVPPSQVQVMQRGSQTAVFSFPTWSEPPNSWRKLCTESSKLNWVPTISFGSVLNVESIDFSLGSRFGMYFVSPISCHYSLCVQAADSDLNCASCELYLISVDMPEHSYDANLVI